MPIKSLFSAREAFLGPFKHRRKRAMTLLEVMIAMVLTMLLLSTLSYMFLFVEKINQQSESKQERAFASLYLEERLNYLLRHAYSPRSVDHHYYFFTSQTQDGALFKPGTSSLVFSFDNGNVVNKPFAGHVIGRLYVNHMSQLVLAVWPLPTDQKKQDSPVHKEVLLNNVSSLEFFFLVPPLVDRSFIHEQAGKKQLKKMLVKELPQPGFDHRQWRSDYPSLPAVVKIQIKQDQNPLTFSIPLPHSDLTIVYGGGKG